MNLRITTLATMVLLAMGCKSGDSTTDAPAQAVNAPSLISLPTRQDAMAKMYDISYEVPQDFFVDERAATPRSYTVHHVKDAGNAFELCTDSYDEAAAFEEADNATRSISGVYVGSIETDKYFEFVRELDYASSVGNVAEPTSPGFARVFKCAYVNRDGVDRNLRSGYAGELKPMHDGVVSTRELVEYLWQFTFFWPEDAKVLQTVSDATADDYRHTLVLGLRSNVGDRECDRIEIVTWTFSADRDSGLVYKEWQSQDVFEAQLVDDVPAVCET